MDGPRVAFDPVRAKMHVIESIASKSTTKERALRSEAIVWICSECFEPYDARPPGGHCLNAGHAPVKLFRARVRSIRAPRGARVVPLRPTRA